MALLLTLFVDRSLALSAAYLLVNLGVPLLPYYRHSFPNHWTAYRLTQQLHIRSKYCILRRRVGKARLGVQALRDEVECFYPDSTWQQTVQERLQACFLLSLQIALVRHPLGRVLRLSQTVHAPEFVTLGDVHCLWLKFVRNASKRVFQGPLVTSDHSTLGKYIGLCGYHFFWIRIAYTRAWGWISNVKTKGCLQYYVLFTAISYWENT